MLSMLQRVCLSGAGCQRS